MRNFRAFIPVLLVWSLVLRHAQRFEVTVPSTKPLNGHLVLMMAKSEKPEPRMLFSEDYLSA